MRTNYIIIILLLFTSKSYASERSTNEMRLEAFNVLTKNDVTISRANSHKNIEDIKELKSMDKLSVLGYVSGGFAVIAKDKNYDAVLGYSQSQLPDTLPCGFNLWIETMNNVMKSSDNSTENNSFTTFIKDNGLPESIAPFITTKWGQSQPFNNKCILSNGNHQIKSITGCVATAMAQILKYYEYPKRGCGSHTYQLTIGNTTYYPSTNFEKEYAWSDMLDEYKNGNYTNIQADAVSDLMYDCGVSVDMRYGGGSLPSCASVGDIQLMTFFDYDDCCHYYRRDFSDEEWKKMVYKEIAARRPVMYDASSSSGAHAFVLNGYDKEGNVYVNWGWNGSTDGFYNIDLLNGYSNSHGALIIHQGLKGEKTKELTLSSPGTLKELAAPYIGQYRELKINGILNNEDLDYLHSISGSTDDVNGESAFYSLDLTDAIFDTDKGNVVREKLFEGVRIKKVLLPKTTVSIGDYAFNRSKICNPSIPSSVKSLGKSAFGNCGITSIEIPEGVEYIGEDCFMNDANLSSIKLPSTLTHIDNYAFISCRSLTNLVLPEGLERLGHWFIADCPLINRLDLPNSLKRIDENAFDNCGLESILIPANVDSIGGGLFGWNKGRMKSIKVSPNNHYYDSREDCNAIIETASNTFIAGCESSTIPLSVEKIGKYAFSGIDISSITIPNKITTLGESSFANTTKLKNINLPCSLKVIGDYAFSSSALESVNIPEGVDSIGRFCFSHAKLKSCIIPNSLKHFARLAFIGCADLAEIWSYIENPELIEYDPVFIFDDGTLASAKLYIPKGTKEKYQTLPASSYWNFSNIVEFDVTNIKNTSSSTSYYDVYSIQGNKVKSNTDSLDGLPSGIYIVNGNKVIK